MMRPLQTQAQRVCASGDIRAKAGECLCVVDKAPQNECRVYVEKGATLYHYRFCDANDARVDAQVEEGGYYEVLSLLTSGGAQKIFVSLNGAGAESKSDAVYVLKDDDKGSFETKIVHNADDTVSSQLIKGAASGNSEETFEGTILILSGHKGIDGSQQHRAVLLSDKASVMAVPRLEIYSDDVKCAHGSAIGDLDEYQLYYLQTRGIPEAEAKKILVSAFLNEVTDTVNDEALRDEFSKRIEAALPF